MRTLALVALIVRLLGPLCADAAVFAVTKTADTADDVCNADCSLREAILAANALAVQTAARASAARSGRADAARTGGADDVTPGIYPTGPATTPGGGPPTLGFASLRALRACARRAGSAPPEPEAVLQEGHQHLEQLAQHVAHLLERVARGRRRRRRRIRGRRRGHQRLGRGDVA